MSFAPVVPLRESRGWALRALATLVTAAVVFAVASGQAPIAPVLALTVAGVLAVLALRFPQPVMYSSLALVALIPIYWGRPTLGRSLVAVPVTVTALVLLAPAAGNLSKIRPQALDVWYVAFIGFLSLAGFLNVSHGTGAAVGLLWRYLLPYVVWRAVTLRWLNWSVVLSLLVAVGTLLSGLAIEERATGTNPFFTWVRPVYESDQWARSNYRNGVIRTEASFGEPISFGLFLAVCVIAAVALVVTSRHVAVQVVAIAAAVTMLVAIGDTQSRAALGAAVIGTVAYLLRVLSPRRAGRIIAVTALASVAVLVTPVVSEVQHALSSGSGTTREAASAQYRLAVLDVLEQPSNYTLIGKHSDQASGVGDLGVLESGLKSLDNEYAYVLVTGGVLGFAALVGLAMTLIIGALRVADPEPMSAAVSTALAVVAVALLVVALLTQLADIFGIGIAMLASDAQRRRAGVT
jgi:hypothetical protein